MADLADPVPPRVDDPVNAAILAVSEDRVQGFVPIPSAKLRNFPRFPLPW
jgi:hypothetical protein